MTRNISSNWSADESHPPSELLFLAMERELSGQDGARVQKHVDACWQCRAQLEKWQEATSAFVDYRTRLQQAARSVPRSGWSRFRLELRNIAAEYQAHRSIFSRSIMRILPASWHKLATNRPLWAAFAFASVVVAVIVYLSAIPPVSAKELLVRAVAQEKPLIQRVRIRTKSRQYLRETGRPRARQVKAPLDADEARLAARFQEAKLDWDDPLSARAFESWHGRAGETRDRVRSDDHSITLETTASDGPIYLASLTVRSSDFHPIAETIRFTDSEVVEISELEARPATAAEVADSAEMPREREPEPAPVPKPHRALPTGPSVEELDRAEVAARVKLHEFGADIGEQIDIARANNRVEVTGVVDSAAEKQQLSAALNGIPNVQTSLSSPEDVPPEGLKQALMTPPAMASVPQEPLLREWLEQRYPDPAERRAYVDGVVADSQECLRRAYALQHLATRYPALDSPEISAVAKDHLVVLQEKWQTLLKTITPVLEVPPGTSDATIGPSWPSDAEVLLNSLKDFDSGLVRLFVGAQADSSQEQIATGVPATQPPDLQTVLTKARTQAQVTTQTLTRLMQPH